jgi:hypothetical protein
MHTSIRVVAGVGVDADLDDLDGWCDDEDDVDNSDDEDMIDMSDVCVARTCR